MGKGIKFVNKSALYLVSIGALNWLLVSLANFNLVDTISTALGASGIGTLIYTLIGASGAWIGIQALMGNINVK